ncbi:MAG TPA: FmdB family zinc ribbon protein [Bryobacterales bacterium]|nr:FmdB family zinc ribbon protein [Bryobacterales bacterium]
MPVYEYECLKCGAHFDEIQKFSDRPVRKHNGCGGKVKRVLSAPAFRFKGTGWYVTDYARKGNGSGGDGKDGKKDAGAEAKAESKAGGEKGDKKEASAKKDEAKPASKSTKS